MKKFIYLPMFLVLFSGCFEHREAPERPLKAKSMKQAMELKADAVILELCGERIDALSPELAQMPKLRQLYLRDAYNITSLAVLPQLKLTHLDMSGTDLQTLPPEVLQIPTLTTLYLTGNNISALPAGFDKLGALTYLNLDRNSLAVLPGTFPAKLRWIRLNGNKLETLPAGWSGLNPERVYLRNNRFAQIPEVVKNWTALTDLSMSGNPVREFPAWLAQLSSLKNIDLDDSQIAKLPDDLSALKNLQYLSLRRCPIPDEEKTRIRKAFSEYRTHVSF